MSLHAINYDSVIEQLRAYGLLFSPSELLFDNEKQRFFVEDDKREKRGWAILRAVVSAKGNTYINGIYGIWRGNESNTQRINFDAFENKLTPEDWEAIREAQKAAQKAADLRRKHEIKQAAEWAELVWSRCLPCESHEYLTRKQIKAHKVRIVPDDLDCSMTGLDEGNHRRLMQAKGALVVPMHNVKGRVQGLQFIYPKGHARTKLANGASRDKEFWPKGMAMGGSFGIIGAVRRNGVLLCAEGYATAASLHEATSHSVIYAFSANNLEKVVKEIRGELPSVRILLCADDDYLTENNPGCTAAAKAAASINHGAWIKPEFPVDENGNDKREGKKLTDFNDLYCMTGLPLTLAEQVNHKLDELKWRDAFPVAGTQPKGEGKQPFKAMLTIDEGAQRFWGIYGMGGKVVFDEQVRRIVAKDDMLNLLPERAWNEIRRHPNWRVVDYQQIGFDPTEQDENILCNLYGGWPTTPRKGNCHELIGLLEYLCSADENSTVLFDFVIKWLAYPIQNPGAKMDTCLVFHGPQGSGKNLFFESYGAIFGEYFVLIGQSELEDKHNSDWQEKRLFVLADEVVASGEAYETKNKIKHIVTGKTVRINPKNIAAHHEKNHFNLAMLSNERLPTVLETGDRRNCVVWVPQALGKDFFEKIVEEIENDGVAALHDYLLRVDLTGFNEHTKPPMTKAKQDLIELGISSEERFVRHWMEGDVEYKGKVVPFMPCLGTHLFQVYEHWCDKHSERKRNCTQMIGYLTKLPDWKAGTPISTYSDLKERKDKKRRMVVPCEWELSKYGSSKINSENLKQTEWLTVCYFEFAKILEIQI